MGKFTLCTVDVVPPSSGVEAEMRDGGVRFRAFRTDQGERVQESEWSGWFDTSSCPIVLTWATFGLES